MLSFLASRFMALVDLLRVIESHFDAQAGAGRTLPQEPNEKELEEFEKGLRSDELNQHKTHNQVFMSEWVLSKASLMSYLDSTEAMSASLELRSAMAQIKRLRNLIDGPTNVVEFLRARHDIHIAIRGLNERVQDELENRRLFYMPSESMKYFSAEPLFGPTVQSRFPEMTADIVDAGLCLGIDRATAAVFHLMCVMEHAIQRLAKRLNVPKRKVQHKDWGTIFKLMNDAVQSLPRTSTKEKNRLQRLSEHMMQLTNVKDAWRNPTMHSRRRYTVEEAKAIFENVKTFVNHLAMPSN
jgi:hypothetical protein